MFRYDDVLDNFISYKNRLLYFSFGTTTMRGWETYIEYSCFRCRTSNENVRRRSFRPRSARALVFNLQQCRARTNNVCQQTRIASRPSGILYKRRARIVFIALQTLGQLALRRRTIGW